LLVSYYKSFDKLVEKAIKWKIGHVINPSGREFDLNPEKMSPLILVDPVQPNRNAAAALSLKCFERFVAACRLYSKKKDEDFFKIKKIKLDDLEGWGLVITGEPIKGKRDIVGTRLLKVYELFLSELKGEGYVVSNSGWEWNEKVYYWFNIKNPELSPFKERQGPPVEKVENATHFRTKHAKRKIIERDGRLYVVLPRQITKLRDYVKWLIKNTNAKDSVKGLKLM
jgi:tRNA nucleotidyltransferase (CCA-adding enzyme)